MYELGNHVKVWLEMAASSEVLWLPCIGATASTRRLGSVPRDFSSKHQKNNPHDKYAITVLPVDAKVAKIHVAGRFTVFCPCSLG